MREDTSYLLSTLQVVTSPEAQNIPVEELEAKILREQPRWYNYLEKQTELLHEAISIFKSYDKKNKLRKFWDQLLRGNPHLDNNVFDTLFQLAQNAYDNGVLQDAHKMLSFVSTYYPRNISAYILLGNVIQQLYGYDEAQGFYKNVTALFSDPTLFLLAAENEMQLQHEEEAIAYLQKAKTNLESRNLSEIETELSKHVDDLLVSMQPS